MNLQSDDLKVSLEGLVYDSIVIIFGFFSGEYIPTLQNLICEKNKVLILEPSKEIYDKYYKQVNKNENIKMMYYEKNSVEKLLSSMINVRNFNNLYVHAYNEYIAEYNEEYNSFIDIIDNYYISAHSSLHCTLRFKELFIENMFSNIDHINDSILLNEIVDINKDVPCLVVSAGPSLDKNLADLSKFKDKLKDIFIISGNRTVKALLNYDIIPDLVVSIDPIDAIYDMMKDYLDLDTHLAYYEYSNKSLVKEFKGDKVYISGLFSKVVDELKNAKSTYSGGSVAHTCVDIASIIGCSPIILIGQDLAHTNNRYHSKLATFDIDKINDKKNNYTITKDINNNEIETTMTLNRFKINLEKYISFSQDREFINCSYGAYINGCNHLELSEVLDNYFNNSENNEYKGFKNTKKSFPKTKHKYIDNQILKNEILNYISQRLEESQVCIRLCDELRNNEIEKDLLSIDKDDEDLHKFLFVLECVNKLESDPYSNLLGGYFSGFLYTVKNKYFNMKACDYNKYTSNLKYQSSAFYSYFKTLEKVLEEVKSIIYLK